MAHDSTARSASARISPRFDPGPRASSASPNGSSSCTTGASCKFDSAIASSEILLSFACLARTPRTKSSAISASIAGAEIGAASVTERLTERRSAKRTRTETVRPGRDLGLRRAPILSASCQSVGPNTLSCAGLLPRADCAPADCPRGRFLMPRGSRLHASAANLSPAARPSKLSSRRPGVAASWPIV